MAALVWHNNQVRHWNNKQCVAHAANSNCTKLLKRTDDIHIVKIIIIEIFHLPPPMRIQYGDGVVETSFFTISSAIVRQSTSLYWFFCVIKRRLIFGNWNYNKHCLINNVQKLFSIDRFTYHSTVVLNKK